MGVDLQIGATDPVELTVLAKTKRSRSSVDRPTRREINSRTLSKIPEQSYAYQAAAPEMSDDTFLHWGRCYSDFPGAVEGSSTF